MEAQEEITEASNQEVWKPVFGYEDLYEVSDHGRVRSLDRVATDSVGRVRKYKGKVLKQGGASRRNYPVVGIWDGGEGGTRYVHRLVWEAFKGPIPVGLHVDHIDNNPANNRIENLQVLTPAENVARQKLFGTSQACKARNGTHNQSSKTHCPRGHEFYPEILTPADRARGGRKCKVCHRAGGYIRYHRIPEADHWAVYDMYLERFLLEA